MLKTVMSRSAIIAFACALSLSAYAMADGTKRAIQIPSGDLATALEILAKQSGADLVYRPDQVHGFRTGGVKGELSTEEAVTKLLQGTPLVLSIDSTGAMLIALPATGSNEAPEASTSAARSKSFWSRLRLAQADSPAKAELQSEDEQQAPSQQRIELEEIVVIGTHIRGVKETASPVMTFTRQDIEQSGYATVGELFRALPQNGSGGYNNEEGNSLALADVRFSAPSTINLRGLGSAGTLVLFNGRRLAPGGDTSLVDVSMIPLSAIERVDVLLDGASAIYGSDAVAGVVNFVTRRDYAGAQTTARFGAVTRGDLREVEAVQSFGTNWDRSNVFFNYQYLNRDDLNAIDRDFTRGAAYPGASNRNEIDILPQQESHHALLSGTHAFTDRLSAQADVLYAVRSSRFELVTSRTTLAPLEYDTKSKQYAATLAGFYDLTPSWQFELAGVFGKSERDIHTIQPTATRLDQRNVPSSVEAQLVSIEPKVSGPLFALPGGEVRVALGGRYSEEDLLRTSRDVQVNKAASDFWAAFAEAAVPIVGEAQAIPGVRSLDLSLAVRTESYSDFGETTDPKFGLTWSPTASLRLRGTWGTSYRAPTLYSLDFDQSKRAAIFADFTDPTAPDGRTTALLEFSSGNNELLAETSTAYTMGLDYRPAFADGLSMSLTYFNVEFDDRIAQPVAAILNAFVDRDLYASLIVDRPTLQQVNAFVAQLGNPALGAGVVNFTGRPFNPAEVEALLDDRLQNIASTDTNGVDFSLAYAFASRYGDVELSLNGSYLLEFVDRITPNAPPRDIVDTVLHPIDLRVRAGTSLRKGGWSVAGFVNYADSYTNTNSIPARKIDAWTTLDLNFAYTAPDHRGSWLDGSSITLNVRNAFDSDPPSLGYSSGLIVGPGFAQPVDYDATNATALGRFISLQVQKRW